METSRECTGCMNVEISKTRLTELRRKADLAQSLADALGECTNRLELFLSTFGDMGDQYATQADLNDWQAALSNYRKGE